MIFYLRTKKNKNIVDVELYTKSYDDGLHR